MKGGRRGPSAGRRLGRAVHAYWRHPACTSSARAFCVPSPCEALFWLFLGRAAPFPAVLQRWNGISSRRRRPLTAALSLQACPPDGAPVGAGHRKDSSPPLAFPQVRHQHLPAARP